MIDARVLGDDKPVARKYECPKCDRTRRTDSARLCQCGAKMRLVEESK